MPRTKVKRAAPTANLSTAAKLFMNTVNQARKEMKEDVTTVFDDFLDSINSELQKSMLSFPRALLCKTVGELMDDVQNWSCTTTSISITNMLESTKSLTAKKRPLRRSASADDEGYLTAESSKSTSGGRQSRARARTLKVPRSISAQNKTGDRFKTPAHCMVPPSSYGTVTPKVKPNTPQVLLRRPIQGEVALSLQGSPLMTGTVVTDNFANINIPLDDGRVLSIQPQRGLRLSQIPALNLETTKQLEALRDNLNKVCALTTKKKK